MDNLPHFQIGAAARHLTSPVASSAAMVLITPEDEADFLASSWPRQHALLAALSVASTGTPEFSPDVATDIRRSFKKLEPREFLEEASGMNLPGVLGVFERLGALRPRRRQAYLDILAILSMDGQGAKTLRHFPHPKFEYIEALAALPDWLRSENFIFDDPTTARQVGLIGEALLASGAFSSRRDVHGILSSRDFAVDPFQALARCGISFSFPQAPWRGPHLEQVRGTKELCELGRRYRNCAARYNGSLLRGSRYFFLWREAREILVDVYNPSGLCWIVHEVEAADKMNVDGCEKAAIASELCLEDYNLQLWRQGVSSPGSFA